MQVFKAMLDGVIPLACKRVFIGNDPAVTLSFLREASLLWKLRHGGRALLPAPLSACLFACCALLPCAPVGALLAPCLAPAGPAPALPGLVLSGLHLGFALAAAITCS